MGTISKLPGKKTNGVEPKKPTPEERFVTEFLIDRDPVAAALRAGVARINVEARLKKWMGDPAINKAIQEATDNQDLDSMVTPQRIMAGFIDIANDKLAPPAARNTALKELAAIKKMYPEKGDPEKGKKPKSVMFVPAIPALEDWKEAAMAQQKKLKDDVRD